MRLRLSVIVLLAVAAGACASPPVSGKRAPVVTAAATSSSSIAGKTLRCNAGGPTSNLTFGADGRLSGQLLQTDVTGTWHAIDSRSVHAHVIAGAVSLRDDLRLSGRRWVGRTTSCFAG